jgi:hypothetical protein
VKKVIILAALMLAAANLSAFAQYGVMDRKALALGTAGTATWTQNVETANVLLQRISVKNAVLASDTVTVTRITGETAAETNTVTIVPVVLSVGGSNLTHAVGGNPVYLKRNDKLSFASTGASNATCYIEYLIQTR